MRILGLAKYGPLAPSSRVRMYQFVNPLARRGIKVSISPLLPDSYVRALYDKRPTRLAYAIAGYFRRSLVLARANKYDGLWVEKELLPYLPVWATALRVAARPYVMDFDDAVFHYYDKPWLRPLFAAGYRALVEGVRQAALVNCGNPYIASWATKSGARAVEVVPTVVDLEHYPLDRAQSNSQELVNIGWIGTPTTVRYLTPIFGALQRLSKVVQMRFVVVGATIQPITGVNVDCVPWSEVTEAHEIERFDIGIMPLENGPLQRGKCGYKLIQYMACGKPTVASPVGANSGIVEHGRSGFLAESENDWYSALLTLCESPELRSTMGAFGRRKVELHYSVQTIAPQLADLFEEHLS